MSSEGTTFIIQQVHADQTLPECMAQLQPLTQVVSASSAQSAVQRCWDCLLPPACMMHKVNSPTAWPELTELA